MKLCERCLEVKRGGATLTFANGKKRYFCKPCALSEIESNATTANDGASASAPPSADTIAVEGSSVAERSDSSGPPTPPKSSPKQCSLCSTAKKGGAVITFANGSTAYYCKSCIQSMMRENDNVASGDETALSSVEGTPFYAALLNFRRYVTANHTSLDWQQAVSIAVPLRDRLVPFVLPAVKLCDAQNVALARQFCDSIVRMDVDLSHANYPVCFFVFCFVSICFWKGHFFKNLLYLKTKPKI